MAVVKELLRSEADGSISFGNHRLEKKEKVEDYEHAGDLLKVKTCREITKLEKNGLFLYESVPGTSVTGFSESENGVEFTVEGDEPEDEPRGGDPREGEERALHENVPEAEKEQEVEAREGVDRRKDGKDGEDGGAYDGGELHERSMRPLPVFYAAGRAYRIFSSTSLSKEGVSMKSEGLNTTRLNFA